MRTNGEADLFTALGAWAEHEARGRWHVHSGFGNGEFRGLDAVEFLFKVRPTMVSRILEGNPIRTDAIELQPEDLDCILTYDGRTLGVWTQENVFNGTGDVARYVTQLAESKKAIEGPIFCLQKVEDTSITVFDGTHRLAAWLIQVAQKCHPDTVSGYLVRTTRQVRGF